MKFLGICITRLELTAFTHDFITHLAIYEKINIKCQKRILSLCKFFKLKNEGSGNKYQIKKRYSKIH